jgi:hypothetical protein
MMIKAFLAHVLQLSSNVGFDGAANPANVRFKGYIRTPNVRLDGCDFLGQ